MSMDLFAYVLSGFTLANLWLAGNLNRWTWWVGIVGQFLWLFYVARTEQWGLLIGVVGIFIVMVRNQMKWIKEGRA
ncbi:MAG TPA: hypothetical protein VIG24_12895 [Acidimicrobiia bacterium]